MSFISRRREKYKIFIKRFIEQIDVPKTFVEIINVHFSFNTIENKQHMYVTTYCIKIHMNFLALSVEMAWKL